MWIFQVPGLYFAGSLAHGKDRGRAVGGVIKGFRHTAKALFHILERKYQSEPIDFPCTTYAMPSEAPAMLDHALRRINEAPDLYNMVYTLVDGVFFDEGGAGWNARYCEGMPFEYINKMHGHEHRLIVMMGFDGQRRDLDMTIKHGIGFEPWLWYWAPDSHITHKEVFRMVESAHTDWGGELYAGTFKHWGISKVEQVSRLLIYQAPACSTDPLTILAADSRRQRWKANGDGFWQRDLERSPAVRHEGARVRHCARERLGRRHSPVPSEGQPQRRPGSARHVQYVLDAVCFVYTCRRLIDLAL